MRPVATDVAWFVCVRWTQPLAVQKWLNKSRRRFGVWTWVDPH